MREAGPRVAGVPERLAAVVGADHVRTDAGALEVYGRDATPLFRSTPDVVCFPGSTAEVQGVVRLAREEGVPVVVRGAGTNLSAATVPQHGGIVLVLTRMAELLGEAGRGPWPWLHESGVSTGRPAAPLALG